MREDFLHYIWKFKYFNLSGLKTTEGELLQVIQCGTHNTDSGPDFLDARLKIGDTLWAGNVEIHTRASDWKKHAHHKDKAYDNVILHVVYEADTDVFHTKGTPVSCLELKGRIDLKLYEHYEKILESKGWIPCQEHLEYIDDFVFKNWIDRLVIERVEDKTNAIAERLEINKNNWEETFYQFIARNFGLKVNAEPFEQLARSLPLNVLAKHKNNLLQIEALLFGQAGFLEENFEEDYTRLLKKEYAHLRKKYSLQPLDKHIWKLLRLRPGNFPTIRIAQLAQLINCSSKLFSKVMETTKANDIKALFQLETSGYWQTHYLFGKSSKKRTKTFGENAVRLLIINTVVPFLFLYGRQKDSQQYIDKSLKLLESLPPEDNSIISNWAELDVRAESAYDTQGLLQLKNEYCFFKKCLHCAIGHKVLSKC